MELKIDLADGYAIYASDDCEGDIYVSKGGDDIASIPIDDLAQFIKWARWLWSNLEEG